MNLKKSVLSVVILLALFTGKATADPYFFIDGGQYLSFDKNDIQPETKAGLTISFPMNIGDIGDAIGWFDFRIFCDYSFRWWVNSAYKSRIEPGVEVNFFFLNAGLVPTWSIEDNTFDMSCRLGLHLSFFNIYSWFDRDVSYLDEHFGIEPELYFQIPFVNTENFEFVIGAKIFFSPMSM